MVRYPQLYQYSMPGSSSDPNSVSNVIREVGEMLRQCYCVLRSVSFRVFACLAHAYDPQRFSCWKDVAAFLGFQWENDADSELESADALFQPLACAQKWAEEEKAFSEVFLGGKIHQRENLPPVPHPWQPLFCSLSPILSC